MGVDGKVTFRLYAPEAKKVTVDTEGAEAIPGITNDEVMETTKNVPFTRTENGIWSITLGHFPPGVNRYSYKVDGLTLADPKSIGTCVDRNLLFATNNVPGFRYVVKMQSAQDVVSAVKRYGGLSKTYRSLRTKT